MPEAPDPLDVLQLAEDREGPILRFGTVEAGRAVRKATSHQALNDRSTADIELDLGLLAGQPVDYLSIVTLGSRRQRQERTHFTGNVLSAEPDGSVVRLTAETAPELTERQMGFLEVKNAVVPEAIHLAVSEAGFPEDRINIEGLDDMLPLEAIEVVVPVHGVHVLEAVDLGPLRLVPSADAANAVDEFNLGEAHDEFQSADAYIVGVHVAKRLLDAEREILSLTDEALAWVAVRARYGLAVLPERRIQEYSRVIARARPRRGDLVLVRAMSTGRRWFRGTTSRDEDVQLTFDPTDATWKSPPRDYSLSNRHALLACARAARTTDPLERIQALWESIEFHVAKIRPPILFDAQEVKSVRRAIPQDTDPKLRARALDLLAKINDPPLLAKLREAIRLDGVPIAEGELDLLSRLRKARNDAVHGRTPELPLREDIDHAVSIVARLLVYRLERWRRGEAQDETVDD